MTTNAATETKVDNTTAPTAGVKCYVTSLSTGVLKYETKPRSEAFAGCFFRKSFVDVRTGLVLDDAIIVYTNVAIIAGPRIFFTFDVYANPGAFTDNKDPLFTNMKIAVDNQHYGVLGNNAYTFSMNEIAATLNFMQYDTFEPFKSGQHAYHVAMQQQKLWGKPNALPSENLAAARDNNVGC